MAQLHGAFIVQSHWDGRVFLMSCLPRKLPLVDYRNCHLSKTQKEVDPKPNLKVQWTNSEIKGPAAKAVSPLIIDMYGDKEQKHSVIPGHQMHNFPTIQVKLVQRHVNGALTERIPASSWEFIGTNLWCVGNHDKSVLIIIFCTVARLCDFLHDFFND